MLFYPEFVMFVLLRIYRGQSNISYVVAEGTEYHLIHGCEVNS